MAVDTALTGMIERKPFPRAAALPPAEPGSPCAQCQGDLVRLDGKLFCGQCGWPADRESPQRLALTVGMDSRNADLTRRVQQLEAENALLRSGADEKTPAKAPAVAGAPRKDKRA